MTEDISGGPIYPEELQAGLPHELLFHILGLEGFKRHAEVHLIVVLADLRDQGLRKKGGHGKTLQTRMSDAKENINQRFERLDDQYRRILGNLGDTINSFIDFRYDLRVLSEEIWEPFTNRELFRETRLNRTNVGPMHPEHEADAALKLLDELSLDLMTCFLRLQKQPIKTNVWKENASNLTEYPGYDIGGGTRTPNPILKYLVQWTSNCGLSRQQALDFVVDVDATFTPPRPLELLEIKHEVTWKTYWTRYAMKPKSREEILSLYKQKIDIDGPGKKPND
jgi:hypothetical protein